MRVHNVEPFAVFVRPPSQIVNLLSAEKIESIRDMAILPISSARGRVFQTFIGSRRTRLFCNFFASSRSVESASETAPYGNAMGGAISDLKMDEINFLENSRPPTITANGVRYSRSV